MEGRVLNFSQACKYTGFSESYMYKLTSAGKIPHSKPLGKTLFFDREKLDAWLLSNGTSSNEQKESAAATYITTHT
jgi:excisionase family DNA binding protein